MSISISDVITVQLVCGRQAEVFICRMLLLLTRIDLRAAALNSSFIPRGSHSIGEKSQE